MKLATALIAAQLIGGYALADQKRFGDGTLPDYLTTYDVDGNGVIDEEERQAIIAAREEARAARMAEIDTDGDGVISDEEREAARQAILAEIEAKRAEEFAAIAGEDGLLTLDEFSKLEQFADVDPLRVEALFDHLDTDDSGDVTFEEFTARLRHHDGDRHGDRDGDYAEHKEPGEGFAAAAGEDGVLSPEEFATLPQPEGSDVAAAFAELDTDGDGFLTLEEYLAGCGDRVRDRESDGPHDGDAPGDGDGNLDPERERHR